MVYPTSGLDDIYSKFVIYYGKVSQADLLINSLFKYQINNKFNDWNNEGNLDLLLINGNSLLVHEENKE